MPRKHSHQAGLRGEQSIGARLLEIAGQAPVRQLTVTALPPLSPLRIGVSKRYTVWAVNPALRSRRSDAIPKEILAMAAIYARRDNGIAGRVLQRLIECG
jgi:hypothetical protein